VKLGNRVGRLVDEDILRMNRAIVVFLGFTRALLGWLSGSEPILQLRDAFTRLR
jgi:hypothetical protein